MRVLIVNGYKHVSRPDAIFISLPFDQTRITVTEAQFKNVMNGWTPPYVHNDVSITSEELSALCKLGKVER